MDKTLAAVDCRWLLWLYAVIPLSLAWILLDIGLAQGRILHDYIPTDPANWPFWTIVFGLPPILLLPLLSVLLAWGLTSHQQYPLISIIILTVSFLHYYFEGFIWRGENPHRRQLSFRR
ncbi:MAG: hypothetical protein EA348_09120 [Pseudomonadaceae bacterium]|nr:MAG: hypothetical protein EA348_09120 [Pseudomonadaceae bacterium]